MVFLAPLLAPGALSTGATTGAGSYALQAGGQQAMGEYSKPSGGSYIEEGPNPHTPGTQEYAREERRRAAAQQQRDLAQQQDASSPYAAGFALGAAGGFAGLGGQGQASMGTGAGRAQAGNPMTALYEGPAGIEFTTGEAYGFGASGRGSKKTAEGMMPGGEGGDLKGLGDKMFRGSTPIEQPQTPGLPGGLLGSEAGIPEGPELAGFDPEMFAGLWA